MGGLDLGVRRKSPRRNDGTGTEKANAVDRVDQAVRTAAAEYLRPYAKPPSSRACPARRFRRSPGWPWAIGPRGVEGWNRRQTAVRRLWLRYGRDGPVDQTRGRLFWIREWELGE